MGVKVDVNVQTLEAYIGQLSNLDFGAGDSWFSAGGRSNVGDTAFNSNLAKLKIRDSVIELNRMNLQMISFLNKVLDDFKKADGR